MTFITATVSRDFHVLKDTVSVITKGMDGLPDTVLGFYVYGTKTIYLFKLAIEKQMLTKGFYSTVSHEYMHKILHELEGMNTSSRYDKIASEIDEYHAGDVGMVTRMQTLYPLKDKKVRDYIEYLRKKYKPLNRDKTIGD